MDLLDATRELVPFRGDVRCNTLPLLSGIRLELEACLDEALMEISKGSSRWLDWLELAGAMLLLFRASGDG